METSLVSWGTGVRVLPTLGGSGRPCTAACQEQGRITPYMLHYLHDLHRGICSQLLSETGYGATLAGI